MCSRSIGQPDDRRCESGASRDVGRRWIRGAGNKRAEPRIRRKPATAKLEWLRAELTDEI